MINNITQPQGNITWDKATEEKFLQILEQIPHLVRGIAEVRITRKAESLIRQENRWVIFEKDMVDAFFAETPPAFLSAMKDGMQELGIDFTKYGYSK